VATSGPLFTLNGQRITEAGHWGRTGGTDFVLEPHSIRAIDFDPAWFEEASVVIAAVSGSTNPSESAEDCT
jgi:hypothetical protein